MSCWRKYTSNVLNDVDKTLLKEACLEMGITLDENVKRVSNSWGNADVDCAFVVNNEVQPLGFVFTNHKVDSHNAIQATVSGDFYTTGFNEASFTDQLSQLYQKYNVMDKLEQNNYIVEDCIVDENGEIIIDAYAAAFA